MKTKYKRINLLFYDEAKCIKMLNDLAKKRWILTGFIGSLFIFDKQDPQEIYYQIDYNQHNEEYLDFITSMNYTFIARYKNFSIFYTTDRKVPAIQSDQAARYLALKSNYKIYWNILFILTGVIILAMVVTAKPWSSFKMTWGNWLLNGETNLLFVLLFMAGLFLIFKGLSSLQIIRNERLKLENNQNDNLKSLTGVFLNIKSYLFDILIVLGIAMITVNLILDFSSVIPFIVAGFLLYYLNRKICKKLELLKRRSEIKYKLGWIIVSLYVLMAAFIYSNLDTSSKHVDSNLQNANVIETGIDNKIFFQEYWIHGLQEKLDEDKVYYERFFNCSNDWIATQLFDELIVETGLNHEQIFYYQNKTVDKCYYFNNYIFAINNNCVFAGKVTDIELIDQVLVYYFKQ